MGKARKERRVKERALARAIRPAESDSKRIQQEHIRMIRTREGVKPIAINIGIKPPAVPADRLDISVAKPVIAIKPRHLIVPKARQEVKLKPLPEWKRVFAFDRTSLPSQQALIKKVERMGYKLRPGEYVVKKIIGIRYPQMGMGMDYDAMLIVETADGKEDMIPFFLSGTPVSQDFIDDIKRLIFSGDEIIIKENDHSALTDKLKPEEMMEMMLSMKDESIFNKLPLDKQLKYAEVAQSDEFRSFSAPGGLPSGMMFGVRNLLYLRSTKSGQVVKPDVQVQYQGKKIGNKLFFTIDGQRWRRVKNEAEFRKILSDSMKKKVNIFGKRWVPQSKLSEFKRILKPISAKEMFSQWRSGAGAPSAETVSQGKIRDNLAYEMIKGEWLPDPKKPYWVVNVLERTPTGDLRVIDNRGFHSKPMARSMIAMLKKESK